MDQLFEKLIRAAILAPSGENCQPWKFVIKGDDLFLYNLPERDQSAYSWGQRASYLANGAAIENMVIEAAASGYKLAISLFPDTNDKDLVAVIKAISANGSDSASVLAPFISKRVSNRKPYKKIPLTDIERQAITSVEHGESEARIHMTENPENIKKLAKFGSTNERVLFSNKGLHQFFFSHINWTKKEDDKKSIGFYIKTLEIPGPIVLAFKFFSKWWAMRLGQVIGAHHAVSAVNASIYASSSAMVCITIPDTCEPEDFVNAGRVFERLWLTLIEHNLYLQPVSGLAFLYLQATRGNRKMFSEEQAREIEVAFGEIKDIFNVKDKHIAMMFRIGHADPPTARATRLPPQIVS
jgi:nitroreductase